MSHEQSTRSNLNRRRFLKHAGQGAVMIPLLSLAAPGVWAADKLAEDDPTAIALGYVHDASNVDVAKFPKRAGDEGAKQFCDNCSQYKATDEAGWGTCAIFPNKLVAAKGWCNVWVPVS